MEKTVHRTMSKLQGHHPILRELYHIALVVGGGLLAALGLEAFLIPHGFLDGGLTGISIILSKFIDIPVGVFIAVLNLPFIALTWWKLGRRSALRTTLGVATLATFAVLWHHMDPWTDNYVLALFYGGALLGFGVGIALRNGGALDGTEALATIISNRSAYSVDQLILGINVCVFLVAGFVMDWQSAMSSALLFYVVVSTLIDKIVNGTNEFKSAVVSTEHPEAVAETIVSITKRHVVIDEKKHWKHGEGFVGKVHQLRFILTRLEASELTERIIETDPDAVVVFSEVSSLRGGVYEDLQKSH
jgi:uncharacterized membrane-anchored protein YitT (DUF2179 family)